MKDRCDCGIALAPCGLFSGPRIPAENLSRVPNLDVDLFTNRAERRLDVLDPAAVPEIEKPVHIGFGDFEPSREFRLSDSRTEERPIQFGFRRSQRRRADCPVLCAPIFFGVGELLS
jgi:hypothetical protein